MSVLGTAGARAAAPPRRPSRTRWNQRLFEAFSTYLPLLLMGLLALGTWWLVKNTPMPTPDSPAKALRHEPDYTMHHFTVQRFNAAGPLRAQIDGEVLRHYPDTDTIEVDNIRLRSIGETGTITRASARSALSNGDGSEVQLMGGARVEREATPTQEAATFTGEFLHAFLNTEQVRSHLPMTLQQGNTVVTGDSFEYDNLNRVAVVNGRVRATFTAAPTVKTPAPVAGPGR